MACRAGDIRPIKVLPVALKVTMKVWLHVASDYLALRRQPSHGFRKSLQPAEVHHILRTLVHKHSGWGDRWTFCKVDIAKAYDSVSWKAIDDMFIERRHPFHVPRHLLDTPHWSSSKLFSRCWGPELHSTTDERSTSRRTCIAADICGGHGGGDSTC